MQAIFAFNDVRISYHFLEVIQVSMLTDLKIHRGLLIIEGIKVLILRHSVKLFAQLAHFNHSINSVIRGPEDFEHTVF